MTTWRYTAVPIQGESRKQNGELAGDSAAEVRAALRRIGLQVLSIKEAQTGRGQTGGRGEGAQARRSVRAVLESNIESYMRRRRRAQRAELYDSLATMLESSLPLMEAVQTVIGSRRSGRSSTRSMLVQVRDALRSGQSLGYAMAEHPAWFDPTEIAMVGAAQHAGTLPDVLRSLAERHERSDELTSRLAGALTYPAIVSLVGLGVVVFLSVKTLPSLVQILEDAGIETPMLTSRVMGIGQVLFKGWPVILVILLAGVISGLMLRETIAVKGMELPGWLRRLSPRLLRRMAVARVSLQLAELVRTGIPVVDALRVLAPTTSSIGLRRRLLAAADRAERGEELSTALDDEHWFDEEFRRLLDIGQSSGELDDLLERIGNRYARQARRLIDRLATLLEPAVILTLAFLVGVVVMAALLPLLRIREIL